MIKTETYMTKPEEKTRIVEIRCDVCNERKHDPYDRNNWAEHFYHVDDIKITHEVGTSYPDDSDLKHLQIDMCPDCFTNILLPAIRQWHQERVKDSSESGKPYFVYEEII